MRLSPVRDGVCKWVEGHIAAMSRIAVPRRVASAGYQVRTVQESEVITGLLPTGAACLVCASLGSEETTSRPLSEAGRHLEREAVESAVHVACSRAANAACARLGTPVSGTQYAGAGWQKPSTALPSIRMGRPVLSEAWPARESLHRLLCIAAVESLMGGWARLAPSTPGPQPSHTASSKPQGTSLTSNLSLARALAGQAVRPSIKARHRRAAWSTSPACQCLRRQDVARDIEHHASWPAPRRGRSWCSSHPFLPALAGQTDRVRSLRSVVHETLHSVVYPWLRDNHRLALHTGKAPLPNNVDSLQDAMSKPQSEINPGRGPSALRRPR